MNISNKSKILPLIIILCSFVFLFYGITIAQSNQGRYFGYYWGMSGFTSVRGNVNAMFVSNQWVTTGTISDLVNRDSNALLTLANGNAKGIVDVSSVFFDVRNNYSLRPDWESRWNSYWAQMYANGSLPRIAAFYPIDEPDTHISSTVLNQVAHIIKINVDTTSYQIPVMVALSPTGVIRASNGSYPIPAAVSWLGFDEYDCWGTECFGGYSVEAKFNMIRQIMLPRGGKVFVIPQGFTNSSTPSIQQQQTFIDRTQAYYQLCVQFTDCTGIFVFRYSTDANLTPPQYGVDRMTTLRTYLNKLGRYIVNPPSERLLSLNRPVTVSGTYGSNPGSYAVDSSVTTAWNSGGFPTQWIRIDLGSSLSITRVQLRVGQSPAGNTVHNVWVAGTDLVFRKIAVVGQYTSNGIIIEQRFNPPTFNIRYVKIETTQSPSWVSWPDIQVYGY